MKKRLLFTLVALCTLSLTQARHLAGGSVTWEHLGGRDYVFHLSIVKHCGFLSFPSAENISWSGGTIRTDRDSTVAFQEPGKSTGCILKVGFYSSDTVTFGPSVNFAGGQSFVWSHCCTDGLSNMASQNMYVESILYGDGRGNPAPISTFEAQRNADGNLLAVQVSPVRGKNSLLLGSNPVPGNDVIENSLAPVASGVSSVSTFNSGFSAQIPLPDSSESPLNGAFNFAAPTGIMTYDIALDTGAHLYNVKQEFYKGFLPGFRRLQAEVNNFVVHHLYLPPKNNNAPVLDLPQGFAPRIVAFPGDSINLLFKGLEAGETVSLKLVSPGLDTGFFARRGVPTPQALQWVSANSNGTFSSADSSRARLQWTPLRGHLQGPREIPVYVAARDSQALHAKTTWRSFTLEIVEPVKIKTGGDAQVTFTKPGCTQVLEATTYSGRIRWTPSSAVANDTALQTVFTGNQTTRIFATDPAAPNFSDELKVEVVDTTQFSFLRGGFFGRSLIVRNNTAVPDSAFQWSLDDFPFRVLGDTLSAFSSGTYAVELALDTGCNIRREFTLGFFHVGDDTFEDGWRNYQKNFGSLSTGIPLDSLRGFNFELSQIPFFTHEFRSVTLMGIQAKKGKKADSARLGFKLFETSTGKLLDSGETYLHPPFPGHVILPIDTPIRTDILNQVTLAWYGDSNLRINTIKLPANIPGHVQAVKGAQNQGMPTASGHSLLATSVLFRWMFSVKETPFSTISFYPNPTQGTLVWSKPLPDNGEVTLLSPSGQIVHRQKVAGGSTQLKLPDIPAGMYILRLGERSFKLYME